jgi:hypothetical protein
VTAGLSLGADPPLTSVDMSLEGVGHQATELLLAAIHGGAGVRTDHRAMQAHHPGIIGATRCAGQVTRRCRLSHPQVPAESPRRS